MVGGDDDDGGDDVSGIGGEGAEDELFGVPVRARTWLLGEPHEGTGHLLLPPQCVLWNAPAKHEKGQYHVARHARPTYQRISPPPPSPSSSSSPPTSSSSSSSPKGGVALPAVSLPSRLNRVTTK